MQSKYKFGHGRRRTGSILFLAVIILCFVIVPGLILYGQTALYQVNKARIQNVVEAAGLVAANDLSRIVINDPNFGYVSLSNYPPIGKATCAPDGEPLPVLGINTLVGTVRQNTIVAHELNNDTMALLVERDRTNMDSTIKTLNTTMKAALTDSGSADLIDSGRASLTDNGRSGLSDIQGAPVQPLQDVTAFLKANLPSNIRLQSVKMTSGWLDDGGDSNIAIPQPLRLAQVKTQAVRAGKYKAFTDVPAVNHPFTFAGLGPSSCLVSAATFHPADGKHICSIVKIECSASLENFSQPLAPFGLNMVSTVQAVACCQPFTMPDVGPSGAMTLRFSGGPVPGLSSWQDFLTGGFRDHQIKTYDAIGGDYPVDHEARMISTDSPLPLSTSQQFAEHLYYWLRNGHVRPRIDAIVEMMNEPFRSTPAQIYAYEFARDGSISRRLIARDPFPIGVTSESQNQTVIDTSVQGGLSPIIVFRDDVKNLGTIHGGQHGGQPLAGYPLNWCELPEYGGDEHTAAGLEKGRLGTHLTLIDPAGTAQPEEAINDANFGLFKRFDGRTLFSQPRRSFYSGGLALDIEIGGTTAAGSTAQTSAAPGGPAPLPAILDIPSKRWIFANRKI